MRFFPIDFAAMTLAVIDEADGVDIGFGVATSIGIGRGRGSDTVFSRCDVDGSIETGARAMGADSITTDGVAGA